MSEPPARVAIVTGAARGIGRAIALRLAQDGIDVVVNDLPSQVAALDSLVTEICAKNRRSIAVFGDVSQEAAVNDLVSTTVAEMGGLDVMVANVGIARTAPVVSTSFEQWNLIQSVNVHSAFLSYKAAAIQMIKQGRGGRIIGAASLAAKQGYPEWSAYCASKFAVRGLTQCLAAELRKYGITVNAYAPGFVDTALLKDLEQHRKEEGLDRLLDPELKLIPPEDVAGLVAYLASEESQYVTGQAININGGVLFD